MLPDGRFFKPREFDCHDGTPYPEAWRDRWIDTRDLCDCAREIHGSALHVVSGFRTVEHNIKLIQADADKGTHGVASGSMHLEGYAADLRAILAPATAVYSELMIAYERDYRFKTIDGRERRLRELLGGIAIYLMSNWVHVDTFHSSDGHLRKWPGT